MTARPRDDRELIESLHLTTPLSVDRAIALVDAHGEPLLSRLLADGVPWYLLDATARACEVPLVEWPRFGLDIELSPWARLRSALVRLGATIAESLRINDITRWITNRRGHGDT